MSDWLYKKTKQEVFKIADGVMFCHDKRLALKYGPFKYVDVKLLTGDLLPEYQLKGFIIMKETDTDKKYPSELEWILLDSLHSKLLEVYYEKSCYQPSQEGTADFMVLIESRKGRDYLVHGYWRKFIIPLEQQISGLIPTAVKNLVIKYVQILKIYVMISASNYNEIDTQEEVLWVGWALYLSEYDDVDGEYEQYDKNQRIYR